MMPMNDEKDTKFKCPACGEMLKIEASDDGDEGSMPPKKKVNAGNMPMDNLKSKIQPTTNPPGTPPSMNSY